ncbi:MAG TPA: hypothetical protein VIS99_14610 [Terrimicrobiaceae bacterium]
MNQIKINTSAAAIRGVVDFFQTRCTNRTLCSLAIAFCAVGFVGSSLAAKAVVGKVEYTVVNGMDGCPTPVTVSMYEKGGSNDVPNVAFTIKLGVCSNGKLDVLVDGDLFSSVYYEIIDDHFNQLGTGSLWYTKGTKDRVRVVPNGQAGKYELIFDN